jgi:hypothetical protein
MGFMPLDQSIAWDAGWRILQGQVPFRDFVTTTSLVPGALQAVCFALAGVSWLVYCAHAAVVNGAFAVAVFAVLRGEGLHPAPAAVFGAASFVFFYPPFGVPYGDQHSFFFALLGVLAAGAARRSAPGRAALLHFLVPALLVLAYLSKPVPAAFFLPAIGVLLLWPGRDRLPSRAAALVLGAVVSTSAFAVSMAGMGANLSLAREYLVDIPLDSGARRALYPGFMDDRFRALIRLGGRSGMLFPWAAAGAGVVAAVGVVVHGRRGGEEGRRGRSAARTLAVALLLWVGTALFVGVTRNQARNGHALLPIVLGLLATSLATLARSPGSARDDPPRLSRGVARPIAALPVVLALVAVHDAVRFNATVNATRMVHDAPYDARRAEAARGQLPEALRFLEWGLASMRYTPAELRELVDVVAAEPRPVLLVSDSLVVYALAGKPSLNPNLWYHPGVSMPRPDDAPRIARLEALFVDRLGCEPPGLVVFDPPPGPRRFHLKVLPRVEAWLRERRCDTDRIGPFPVWRLCPPVPAARPETPERAP